MDIDSKRFRVRSTGIAGQVEILTKATGQAAYVHANRLPSVTALATMSEAHFNRIMEGF